MVKRTINKDILDSINKFIEEIKKQYNVTAIILFGAYAKGTETEDSDIDIMPILDKSVGLNYSNTMLFFLCKA